jgi:hypothetical protein
MYTLLQGREQQAKVNKTKDSKGNEIEMAPNTKNILVFDKQMNELLLGEILLDS